jgi:hypothetical protein
MENEAEVKKPRPRRSNAEEVADNWFVHHPPTPNQVDRYEIIRDKCKEVAEMILEYTPECADQTAALRKLRELNMAINLTIACNE